jgi:hypothetical protein
MTSEDKLQILLDTLVEIREKLDETISSIDDSLAEIGDED